ncbi:uncharacterized protein [Ptychodera flava]|uniref:uncharacterized protein n=1 Tax=Ptychodera flava TaxID=63121 RepID=UPI003969C41D
MQPFPKFYNGNDEGGQRTRVREPVTAGSIWVFVSYMIPPSALRVKERRNAKTRFVFGSRIFPISCILTVIFIIGATIHVRQVDNKNSLMRKYSSGNERGNDIVYTTVHEGEAFTTSGLTTTTRTSANTQPPPGHSINYPVAAFGRQSDTAPSKPVEGNENEHGNKSHTGGVSSTGEETSTIVPKDLQVTEKVTITYSRLKTYTRDDSYKQYTQCPTSLRKRLAKSKVFKHRFKPAIPVLMSKKSFSTNEYQRLHKLWRCYGWENVTITGSVTS